MDEQKASETAEISGRFFRRFLHDGRLEVSHAIISFFFSGGKVISTPRNQQLDSVLTLPKHHDLGVFSWFRETPSWGRVSSIIIMNMVYVLVVVVFIPSFTVGFGNIPEWKLHENPSFVNVFPGKGDFQSAIFVC